MPIYEYQCGKCSNSLDKVHNMEDTPPICCGIPMVRQFSAPGLLRICDAGGVRLHSKDYKDDYAKQYRESIGIES